MPAKKTQLTESERRKRIQEISREIETDDSPNAFDRALSKIVAPSGQGRRPQSQPPKPKRRAR